MVQNKKVEEKQVFYNGKWVDERFFRAFVYNKNEQKLANSYDEYEKLISSGIWFSSKDDLNDIQEKVVKLRKIKDGNSDS